MNLSIHALARAVIIVKEHILLCKTTYLAKNFYFLPGGHVEHLEGLEQTLKRELLEEVGYEFEIEKFLGCLEYSFDKDKDGAPICHNHEHNFIFKAACPEALNPSIVIKQLEADIEVVWMPYDKIDDMDLRPWRLKELIPLWLAADDNICLQSEIMNIKG